MTDVPALVGGGDDHLVDDEGAAVLADGHVAGRVPLDLGNEDHVAVGRREDDLAAGRELAGQPVQCGGVGLAVGPDDDGHELVASARTRFSSGESSTSLSPLWTSLM